MLPNKLPEAFTRTNIEYIPPLILPPNVFLKQGYLRALTATRPPDKYKRALRCFEW